MLQRPLAMIFLTAALLTSSGCASVLEQQETGGEIPYNAGEIKADEWICIAFRPIEFSDEDATPTKAQIFEHNAVWEALCPDNMK